MNQKAVLLATIEAALEIRSPVGPLPAQELSRLGRQLGLSDERTRDLVGQLSHEEKVDLEWGGAVKSVLRESGTPSIYLGPNATFVGHGAQIHQSAVGAHARVQIASPSSLIAPESLTQIAAILTVSLDKLTAELNGMTQAQQQICGQLIPLVEAVQKQLLSKDGTQKGSIIGKLEEAEKALGLIDKVGKFGTAAAPYLPRAWEMLHHAIQSLSAIPGLPL